EGTIPPLRVSPSSCSLWLELVDEAHYSLAAKRRKGDGAIHLEAWISRSKPEGIVQYVVTPAEGVSEASLRVLEHVVRVGKHSPPNRPGALRPSLRVGSGRA